MNDKNLYSGVKKRNYQHLIDVALKAYEAGQLLSITELAEKAHISRATAYRYFPTQSHLIAAIVENSLGPIFDWVSDKTDVEERVCDFLAFAFPQMLHHEGALRAALQLSLQQWSKERAAPNSQKNKLIRGNRKEILNRLLSPLEGTITPELYETVLYALSIIYGSEIFMVLKDIWKLDNEKIISLSQWMAKAIINQAKRESLTAE
ncbi:TetR/AcrR family transcriptional regulator [Orbaceae bacterium ESL0727]|nr:TetR/AcrR family transcriptional regulator [Orbaceae bacterium ESL0727]